jgi:hypothetical protein
VFSIQAAAAVMRLAHQALQYHPRDAVLTSRYRLKAITKTSLFIKYLQHYIEMHRGKIYDVTRSSL